MNRPDYQGGSIVNLMSSIGSACGAPATDYVATPLLDAQRLAEARTIVLLVVDGLGYHYLREHHPDSLLARHLQGSLTSVFPTTTATAITSYMTGMAPQQHAFTGWFMWLREYGVNAAILPFRQRGLGTNLADVQLSVSDLIGATSFSERIAVRPNIISEAKIVDSAYSRATSGGAGRQGYDTPEDLFLKLGAQVRQGSERQYIYAYWSAYDGLSHRLGFDHPDVNQLVRDFDQEFARFVDAIAGTDACVLVTADHGFINTGPERYVHVAEHPELEACLSLPLCGEPRAAYCYVRPDRAQVFETYVTTQLSQQCELHQADDLIRDNWFGLGEPDPRLRARIGDYVLIMKDNWVIKDYLAMENPFYFVGVHSGLSEQELTVPLVKLEV